MSLQLHNAIYTLLTSNTGFTALVGTRVYPVIAPADTSSPLVVITRDFTPQHTRDGVSGNDSNVEITILASTYNAGISIAVIVNSILSTYHGSSGGVTIVDCRLINCTEEYSNEAFIQKMFYQLKNY